MTDGGVVRREVEEGVEVLDRQQLGDVRAVLGLLERGDLGQLAVLGRQLGGGRDLDRVGVAERALGERGEPAQRLDLDVEQVDAHRAVLGRREDVEQAAADRELAAVLDLVDALVAGGDEVVRGLVEVEQVADAEREPVRAQRRVGDLLGQRDGGDDDDRRLVALAASRRVERGDAQADEVRRRREVRLVGDAAARVVADGPRREPGAQVGGEVARRAVVAGDDDRRPVGRGPVEQRRDQVRAAATATRTRGRRRAPARRRRSGLGGVRGAV